MHQFLVEISGGSIIKVKNKSMIILTYSGWFLGEKRYFFDGSEANSTRCQCDRTSSCQLDQSCNCFASSKSRKELRDQGKITADWMLPILGFGYNVPDTVPSTTSELKVNVGDLICSSMSIFYYHFNFTLCYLQYVIFYFQTPSILSLKAH